MIRYTVENESPMKCQSANEQLSCSSYIKGNAGLGHGLAPDDMQFLS